MHRVPLWGAVVFLFLLVFVALTGGDSINQEEIWTIIGINFVLIVIPIIKAIVENISTYNATSNFISKQRIKTSLEEKDPETLYNLAVVSLINVKNQDDIKQSLSLLCYAAERGYQPAIELLEKIKCEQEDS